MSGCRVQRSSLRRVGSAPYERTAQDRDEPVVGRDVEMRELLSRLREVRAGEGRIVIVEGAAGIGKTRLLDVGCELARRGGFTVFRGRGSELEREYAFGVVRQLLGRTLDAEQAGDLYAAAAALARPVFDPSPTSIGAAGYPVLHGLYWLLANVADRGPLVLAIDDLQWADRESLGLLLFLAGRLDGIRVLLLVTTREVGDDETAPTVAALSQDPHAYLLTLGPLDPRSSVELVGSVLGATVPPPLATACHEATGGNPFLLRELAVELRDGRGAETDPTAVHTMAPRSIVRAVVARLDRLPAPARALAEAAAVLGDGAELRQAARLAGLDGEPCGSAADALAAAGILAGGRPICLTHPLVGSAVRRTLGAATLAAAHQRAARLLAAEGAGPEAVAAQLLAAEPGEDEWTVTVLRAAARAAGERAAPASAAAYLRRALREGCDRELRAELLLELGVAAGAAAEPDAFEALRAAAALARTPELRVRVAFVLAPALAWTGCSAEAADLVNRTMEAAGDAGDALRQVRLMIALLSVEGRRTTVDEVKQAIPLAMTLRERAPRLLLIAAAHELAVSAGTAAQANDLADLALADGRLLSEYPGDSPFLGLAIAAYDQTGRFAAAERLVSQGIADARTRGAATAVGLLLIQRGCVRMFQGDLARAEADAREGMALAGERRSFLAPLAVGVLMSVELARGRIEHAVRNAELLAPDNAESGSVPAQVWRAACAELCLAQDRPRDALRHLEAAEDWEREWGAHNGVWCAWRPRAARAYAALADAARAEQLSAIALDDARRFGAPHAMGVALSARAEVIAAERIGLLEEAVRRLCDDDSRLLYAGVLTALGAAYRATGQTEQARCALAEAVTLAQDLGASGIERTALAELVEAGGRPRRSKTTGPMALTPAERQIVELAAQGLKNREIAQTQFVTTKTVETHLSSAYRKLRIRSRAQLAGALAPAQN